MSDANARERREFQRIQLERPSTARLGGTNVLMLNIGISGALVEHHGPFRVGEIRLLTFSWSDHEITLDAQVIRSKVDHFAGEPDDTSPRPIYHSGLRFIAAIGTSDQRLRDMIGFYVTRALEIQKANAYGLPFDEVRFRDPLLARGFGRRTGVPTGFIACRLNHSSWSRTQTQKSSQPLDGFTVSAWEPNIDLLCRTYEEANEEGRRLIRMLAEVSVSESRQIPPVRYEP